MSTLKIINEVFLSVLWHHVDMLTLTEGSRINALHVEGIYSSSFNLICMGGFQHWTLAGKSDSVLAVFRLAKEKPFQLSGHNAMNNCASGSWAHPRRLIKPKFCWELYEKRMHTNQVLKKSLSQCALCSEPKIVIWHNTNVQVHRQVNFPLTVAKMFRCSKNGTSTVYLLLSIYSYS